MAGSSPREARFTAILKDAFRLVRSDPLFLLGLLVALGAWSLAIQLGQRAITGAGLSPANVNAANLIVTLINLAIGGMLTGVFNHRAGRISAGNPGTFGSDVAIVASRLPVLAALAGVMAAPNLVLQIYGLAAGYLHWPGIPTGSEAIFLSLVTSIVGLVIVLNWVMAQAVAVVEQRGFADALGRSQSLIRGHRWLTLGLLIVAGLVVIATFPVTFAHLPRPGNTISLNQYSMAELAYVSAIGGLASLLGMLLMFQLYWNLRFGAQGQTAQDAAQVFT